MDHPIFEIVKTTAGVTSIRNKVVNEIMHNPVGPWAEANALYVEQSGLKQKLSASEDSELVLFDIGLGAAANALAALHCAHHLGENSRGLRIISFERDLGLLKFALKNAKLFEHFAGFENALEQILVKHQWSEGKISWELREGNFLELIENEKHKPHLIFFDPYSPKVNQDMWTVSSFEKIHKRSRSPEEGGTLLYTYSQATRIRVALLKAGFFVGYGNSTGLKSETTEASTDFMRLQKPLGQAWLSRWRKSHIRYPFDCQVHEQSEVDSFVEKYFSRL